LGASTRGAQTKSKVGALGLLAGLVVLGVFSHAAILTALGSYLVQATPPQKADIAVVLAGDPFGNRIITGAELAQQGYVPKVLVSGPDGAYGYHECDLAIAFAVKRGYPESFFLHLEHEGRSTEDEAHLVVPELRRLGAKRVLLVTSDFHTRRAAGTFRAVAPDLTFIPVAAPDRDFRPNGWWRNREGRKVFLLEWMKTVANWFGI
jgi:uncharacterized SAM-binding protein YcdF (DUF218 family)